MHRSTAVLALFVPFLALEAAFAALDTIDADGVTERGGPGYARMLPRTGPDGRLDASLLPERGSSSAAPDPYRLYVSASALAGGNGSALSPFTRLQDAVTNVHAGGAVIVAPGRYSASWSLAAGSSVTLVGCGNATVFDTLSVTSAGSSGSAVLRLVAADAVTVSLSGWNATLELAGAKVGTVSGLGSRISVVRTDLGSKVGAAPEGTTDSYTGYDTVPYAVALKGASGNMTLSGARAVVGDETVAFLSDVSAATDAVYRTVSELRTADAAMADTLAAASNALARTDSAIVAALSNETSRIDRRIDDVNKPWEDQMAGLVDAVEQAISGYTNMHASVTNEVAQRQNADIAVRADFAEADSELHWTVSQEIEDACDSLITSSIPDIVASTADLRISAARNGIVSEARDAVIPQILALNSAIEGVSARVDTHDTAISAFTTRMELLRSRVNDLIRAISQLHEDAPDIPYVDW